MQSEERQGSQVIPHGGLGRGALVAFPPAPLHLSTCPVITTFAFHLIRLMANRKHGELSQGAGKE